MRSGKELETSWNQERTTYENWSAVHAQQDSFLSKLARLHVTQVPTEERWSSTLCTPPGFCRRDHGLCARRSRSIQDQARLRNQRRRSRNLKRGRFSKLDRTPTILGTWPRASTNRQRLSSTTTLTRRSSSPGPPWSSQSSARDPSQRTIRRAAPASPSLPRHLQARQWLIQSHQKKRKSLRTDFDYKHI